MHTFSILVALAFSVSGCMVGGTDDPPIDTGGTNSGGSGGGGSDDGGGSGGGGMPVAGEPTLIDTDDDGEVDVIDVEPDGDGDYAFFTETCRDPRIDQDRDGHIEALDLDCNGQIDLIVHPSGAVSPAAGANCHPGTPGQGPGHGAAGVGCD